MIRLAIVLPCYNEEEVLSLTARQLNKLFNDLKNKHKVSDDSFALFVNDGSKDSTWDVICRLHEEYDFVKGLNLAHNVGHQSAIWAGMMKVKDMCDAVVTIDADLQDDVKCIEKMVDNHAKGFDVVYGVKVQRKADSWLKRTSAEMFYKLQKRMGVDMVYNHADFRFLSKRVVEALAKYPERNLYLRGMIPQIGYPSTTVEDVLSERQAGQSKYTLSKMLNLALDGITSFSTKPLYYVVYTGVIFIFISILIAIYVLISLINGTAVHGWASLILSVWFVGGVILIALGSVGAYVGKIYREVKRRPIYNEQDFLD